MGGLCFGDQTVQRKQPPQQKRNQIEKVDEVKFKLKKARDTIKNYINAKNRDLAEIEVKIQEKVPAYKQTGNKKELVPLLKAKKDLTKMIEAGDVRLKVVNQKLDEVQMQKINADTIDALEDSNKYVREIQDVLQKKDWRNILDQAQQKYQIEWPDDSEEVQEDPAFQQMWKELGGDKAVKEVERKKVSVEIHHNQHHIKQSQPQERRVAYA